METRNLESPYTRMYLDVTEERLGGWSKLDNEELYYLSTIGLVGPSARAG
jgi:hypothetical protein